MVAFPRRAVSALTRRSRADWPTMVLGQTQRPAQWSRGQQWLVVIASFLLGLCLASAAFVIVWSREAQRADSTEAALAQADADRRLAVASSADLQRTLTEARSALAAARAELRRGRSLAGGIARSGAALAADAAQARDAAATVAAESESLASGARRLTSAVSALQAYVSKTPASEIDPAYLAAQLSYLDEATRKLRSDSAAVGSGAAALGTAREALAGRIERLRALTARLAAEKTKRSGQPG